MANESLILKIGADVSSLKGELSKIDQSMNQFKSSVTKIAGVASAAFTGVIGSAILGTVVDLSKLSAEAEGVSKAFDKLPQSAKLMHDLKEATHGTVSELDLMKRAVAFSNFNLSLSELPKLLEFATLRAQQTGQSVDYLVDSIVTGLGRKSVLILDNLGLSASMINEEVSKTGDFMTAVGNIVDVELGKMGPVLENNLTKTERLSAEWVNYKVAVGNAANGTGLLGQAIDGLSASLQIAGSSNLSFWDKWVAFFGGPGAATNAIIKDLVANQKKLTEEQKKSEQVTREVDRAFAEWGDNLEGYKKAITQHIYYNEIISEINRRLVDEDKKKAAGIENIANLTARLNELQGLQQTLTGTSLVNTNREIKAIQGKIKALQQLGVEEEKPMKFRKPVEQVKTITNATADFNLAINMEAIAARVGAANQQIKMSFQSLSDSVEIDFAPAINEAMMSIAVGIGNAMGDLLSGVGSAEERASAGLNVIAGIMGQLGQLAIAGGLAKMAIDKAMVTFMGGPGAVAAGIALVALSKMVSNRAAAIAKGGGSGGFGGGASSSAATSGGSITAALGQRIILSGELKVSGTDLKAAITNQNRVDKRTALN